MEPTREVRADAYVTFTLEPDGNVASVKMLPASPDVDFSFDFQDLVLKPVKAAHRRVGPVIARPRSGRGNRARSASW